MFWGKKFWAFNYILKLSFEYDSKLNIFPTSKGSENMSCIQLFLDKTATERSTSEN